MVFLLAIFLLWCGAPLAHANVGVADLMYHSSGARAMSMGGAFTAVADDGSYPFWNPAGIHFQDMRWSHFDMQNFVNYNYHLSASTLVKQGNGRMGLTGVLDLSPGIEAYDDTGNSAGTYSDIQGVANITGGDRWGQNLYWGVSARGIWHGIADSTMFGFAGDVGFLWQMSSRVRLGAVWHAPVSAVSTGHGEFDNLESMTSLGIAHWVDDSQSLLFSADVDYNRWGMHHWATGVEFWLFPKNLAVRGGYHSLNKMSLGLGLNMDGFRLDYAYLNHEYLGNFHQLSVGLLLGPPGTASGVTQETQVPTWTRYSPQQPVLLNPGKTSNDFVAGVAILDESKEYALLQTLEGLAVDIPAAERVPGRHTLEVALKDRSGNIVRQNLFIEFTE